jgi:hypothetical protein
MTWWDDFWKLSDQSPVLAGILGTVIGGLILATILALLALLWSRIRRIPFRQVVGSAWKRVRGLAGFRPVTIRRLRREVSEAKAEGFKERDDAVAAERQSPRPPSWRLRYDSYMGRDENDNDVFWLTNMGFPVSEIEVTGNPAHIVFPRRVVFTGADNGTGQGFAGNITDLGRAEGVTLHITWRNQYGDPGEFDYRLESEDIAGLGLETRPQAYERGKTEGIEEGRAAGIEAGRQAMRAEIDNQRARPPKKARWLVLRDPESPKDGWVLINMAEGTVATEVELDADIDFKFWSATGWDDLSGIANGKFQGYTNNPVTFFTVEWNDANAVRQVARVEYVSPDSGEFF